MAKSSQRSLTNESLQHLGYAVEEVSDIWRHEGLKRGAEQLLYWAGKYNLGRLALERLASVDDDSLLATNIGGVALKGPAGLAAGWDKTGRTILAWQALGANHAMPGGVTLYPQSGNPMTRLRTFDERVGDHGTSKSLNAFGFNSPGASVVRDNIAEQRDRGDVTIPIFPQVTLNKEMYEPQNMAGIPTRVAETIRVLDGVSDGFSLGLSSPNTLGMRDAQAEDFLYEIIMRAKEEAGGKPVELKGDGDGGEERLTMYANLVERTGLDIMGLINTTALERIKAKYGAAHLPGGLAGADPEYQQMAVDAVRFIYEAVGDKVDIVGTGGINSSETALKMIRAGASGVSINTAIRSLGPRTFSIIEGGLSQNPGVRSVGSLTELIGTDTARGPKIKAA